MNLQVLADPQALAARAADFIAAQVRLKPDLTVLVATGNTPMPTYAELERRVSAGLLDCSGVIAVQLDEYLGVRGDDPRSLFGWMQRAFVEPLGIRHVIRFEPALEPEQACARFELEVARAGGIDLAILGLGPNGHLGFNEPPSGPDAPTRALALSPQSLQSNAAYWGSLEVPGHAITAGMPLILKANTVCLLVSGVAKADILKRTLEGKPSPEVPASWLQHANLTVFADEGAAGALER